MQRSAGSEISVGYYQHSGYFVMTVFSGDNTETVLLRSEELLQDENAWLDLQNTWELARAAGLGE